MNNDFKKAYNEIKKHKNKLEKSRALANKVAVEGGKRFMNFFWVAFLIPFLIMLFVIMICLFNENESFMLFLFDIMGLVLNKYVILFVIIFYLFRFLKYSKENGHIQKNYNDIYKELVVKPVVKAVGENLEYFPNEGISKNLYEEAGFAGSFSSYQNCNLILGKYKNYDLNWSFVRTTYESNDSTCVDFRGVVVICNCNKKIDTQIKIISNVLEKEIAYEEHLKKVILDNIDFEKYFNIYGDNEIKVLQFLTADVMDKLLELRKKCGYDFDISINENKLYVRFKYANGLFEAPYGVSPIDIRTTRIIYDVINNTIYVTRYLAKIINEKENLI